MITCHFIIAYKAHLNNLGCVKGRHHAKSFFKRWYVHIMTLEAFIFNYYAHFPIYHYFDVSNLLLK